MNILFLADEIKNTSGVTTHIHNLLNGLVLYSNGKRNKYFLIAGKVFESEKFACLEVDITENENFLHSRRSFRNFFKALTFLRRYCKEHCINIIHSHSHYAANIAYHTSYTVQVKTIQTNHGILSDGGKLSHFKADKYIAINEHIAEHIVNKGFAREPDIALIRCGISVPSVNKTMKSKLKFISASRLVYEKGTDIYIRAVSLLPESYRQAAEFYIAGEGELECSLKKLDETLKTEIIFLGNLRDMSRVLAGTHVLVHPTRANTEGFPSIITEAGALGNLIISSGFPGLTPVFNNMKDGVVFKPGDENDLCEKIKFTIDNFSKLSILTQHFQSKVKELFNLKLMAEKHFSLYQQYG